MLAENGRQPWIVQGLMLTKNGVSASVSATEIWISLSSSTLIYAVLGVANTWLMIRLRPAIARRGPTGQDARPMTADSGSGTIPATDTEPDSSHEDEDDLALVY